MGGLDPVSVRFAVLSDTHRAPGGTADGIWNNVTRLSVSARLLDAAVAEIVAAGHDQVLHLGDVSEFGDDDMISAALGAISNAGLRCWVVAGNHDVISSAGAVAKAAQSAVGFSLEADHRYLHEEIALYGPGLKSEDGGRTCRATQLPSLRAVHARLLVWSSHYPLLSQRAKLHAAGLRYPGDLINLDDVQRATRHFSGPMLVLHGHLHTGVTELDGSLLQVGVPAVVEWPHAWTDITIDIAGDAVTVRTALRSIAGQWSDGTHNTVLHAARQQWTFDGQWSASS